VKRAHVRLFLRLSADVNDRLRTMMRYHGELSRFIDQALLSLDLLSIELKASALCKGSRAITAIISRAADSRVRAAAQQRHCTVTAIANSALDKWLGERHA
jgi:hypothetical protein